MLCALGIGIEIEKERHTSLFTFFSSLQSKIIHLSQSKRMRLIHLYSFILFWRTGNGFSYQTTLRSHESVSTSTELRSSRRSFMNASALGIATIISNAQNSRAEETASEEIEVYFGCGCFWHVQVRRTSIFFSESAVFR